MQQLIINAVIPRSHFGLIAVWFGVLACGGATNAESRRNLEDSEPGTPEVKSVDGPERASCDDAGTRRTALPEEEAQYCTCGGGLPGIWQCYGPPDTDHEQTSCGNRFVNPGTGDGSCVVLLSECSDSRLYTLLCVDSNCQCLVDGVSIGELEPRSDCPEDLAEIGKLCAWNLVDG